MWGAGFPRRGGIKRASILWRTSDRSWHAGFAGNATTLVLRDGVEPAGRVIAAGSMAARGRSNSDGPDNRCLWSLAEALRRRPA